MLISISQWRGKSLQMILSTRLKLGRGYGRRWMSPRFRVAARMLLAIAYLLHPTVSRAQLGIFAGHKDVGEVLHLGAATYDPAEKTYTVTGSGENMWFGKDSFHFVYMKVSGDISLSADVTFPTNQGNNHRKAVLVLRQSLDPGSVYVDVARHGDGLTSLQYRASTGADTHEVESAVAAPKRVGLIRRGNYIYVFVSDTSGKLQPSGASMRVDMSGSYYVGLGVCSHDKNVSETAVFSNVKFERLRSAQETTLYSTLETVTVASTDRRVAYVGNAHFEAPNWSKDGQSLLFNQDGRLKRFALGDSSLQNVPVEAATHINNDHGFSPDGKTIAISDQSADDGKSRISVLPVDGGKPRQVTSEGPSYWHGWSPDNQTIAFTGERNGEFDIYVIPASGGTERRLTTASGLDDGPEFSPDGVWIYFNSERTGHMQIWRMHVDGTGQEQVITEDSNDWFPHLSPDGKWIAFVAFNKSVKGHPPNEDVEIRLMSLSDKKVRVLATVYGGQGTMNVPSWSPDSAKLAFVSYEFLPTAWPR